MSGGGTEQPGERLAGIRAHGGFFCLPARTWLVFAGADRERYLNGQVTNDVRKLKPGCALQACVVSAKGRLDGVVWIWGDEARFLVEVESDLAESLAARFERYLVADDVEITVEAAPAEWHVFGPVAERLIAEGIGRRRIARFGVPGVDVAREDTAEIPRLAEATELRPEDIAVLRIERKLPAWGSELGPDTLPAEARLDRTAVDFHKGCYIGQEVISRIQSVGRTNRMLESFVVTDGPVPVPGAEIFSETGGEKPVGVITSVTSHFELAQPVGLCYTKRGQCDQPGGGFTADGSRLKLCQLPCE